MKESIVYGLMVDRAIVEATRPRRKKSGLDHKRKVPYLVPHMGGEIHGRDHVRLQGDKYNMNRLS